MRKIVIAALLVVASACGSESDIPTLAECSGAWVISVRPIAPGATGSLGPGCGLDASKTTTETIRLGISGTTLVTSMGTSTPAGGATLNNASDGSCRFNGKFNTQASGGTITQGYDLTLRSDGRIVGNAVLVIATPALECVQTIEIVNGHLE